MATATDPHHIERPFGSFSYDANIFKLLLLYFSLTYLPRWRSMALRGVPLVDQFKEVVRLRGRYRLNRKTPLQGLYRPRRGRHRIFERRKTPLQ